MHFLLVFRFSYARDAFVIVAFEQISTRSSILSAVTNRRSSEACPLQASLISLNVYPRNLPSLLPDPIRNKSKAPCAIDDAVVRSLFVAAKRDCKTFLSTSAREKIKRRGFYV